MYALAWRTSRKRKVAEWAGWTLYHLIIRQMSYTAGIPVWYKCTNSETSWVNESSERKRKGIQGAGNLPCFSCTWMPSVTFHSPWGAAKVYRLFSLYKYSHPCRDPWMWQLSARRDFKSEHTKEYLRDGEMSRKRFAGGRSTPLFKIIKDVQQPTTMINIFP